MQPAFQRGPSKGPSVAETTLIRRFQEKAPVDLDGVANALGIKVYTDDLGTISGILRKDKKLGGDSGYVILVNKNHPLNRQRFTVAHEIGHFILHRDMGDEIRDDEFYRALPGPLETEANAFAADLLMPWNLIRRGQDAGHSSLYDLARHLGVSQQALAYRLGLPWDQDWK